MRNRKSILVGSTCAASVFVLIVALVGSVCYGIWLGTPSGMIYTLSRTDYKDYPKDLSMLENKMQALISTDENIEEEITDTILQDECTIRGIELLMDVLGRRQKPESKYALIDVLKQYDGDMEDRIIESSSMEILISYGDSGVVNAVLALVIGDVCQQRRASRVLTINASDMSPNQFRATVFVYIKFVSDPNVLEWEIRDSELYPDDMAAEVLEEISYKPDPMIRFRAQLALGYRLGRKSGIVNALNELRLAEQALGHTIPDARRLFDAYVRMDGNRKPFVELATVERVIHWVESSMDSFVYDEKERIWTVEKASVLPGRTTGTGGLLKKSYLGVIRR